MTEGDVTVTRKQRCLAVILFAVLAFSIYGRSLRNDFVRWDDGLLIIENPIVRGLSWHNVKSAFTRFDPELYIPLTFVSFQVNYAMREFDPLPYHFTNLLLHTLNALLAALFTLKLSHRKFVALFVGLLFLVHPLHTEAVAWASARKDVLSTFFFLGSLIMYLRYCESSKSHITNNFPFSIFNFQFLLSLMLFLLALLSKVHVLMLPFVLLLVDWYQGRTMNRISLFEKIPFFILSILFGIVATFGKLANTGFLWEKFLMGCKASVFYITKMFVPYGFSVLYPYTKPITIAQPDIFVSVFIVIGIIGLIAFLWRRDRRFRRDRRDQSVSLVSSASFGLIFYFLTLLPTFTNIAKGHDELLDVYFGSDRYAYIPSIGIFFIVAMLLERLQVACCNIMLALLIVVTPSLGYLSYKQSLTWKNTESLFEHVIRFYPRAHAAHSTLGTELFNRGDIRGAKLAYETSLAARPNGIAYYNLGQIALLNKDDEEAIAYFRKAMESSPSDIDTYIYLGALLVNTGKAEEAVPILEEASRMNARNATVLFHLGRAYESMGTVDEARDTYERALKIEPSNAEISDALQRLTAAATP